MTSPIETELKLELDSADREGLVSMPECRVAGGRAVHLVSVYFDTPDLVLFRSGFSLRVRREGKRRIQTVKAIGGASAGLFVRPEWERTIRGDRPVLYDAGSPLADLLGGDVARLAPAFETEVQRTRFQIEQEGAQLELAIDVGSLRAGDACEPLCEIEIELRGGSPAALFDLARRIDARVPLHLAVRSKAERGYALLEKSARCAWKAEAIPLDPEASCAESFVAIARSCIRQFRLNETCLLASGDAEALHQARVGLRRLRTAFSLHRALFGDDAQAALLGAELRWLATGLGEVRNLDVLIGRFDGETRELLIAARDARFERVRAELASSRTRLTMLDLAEWLAIGGWRAAPGNAAACDRNSVAFADALLGARRDRLRHRGKRLVALDPAHRHRLRIQAKKLRYASEFFASLYPGDKARRRYTQALEALGRLQDRLGELNDLAVGRRLLDQLGLDARLPKSGKHRRHHLLKETEQAYDRLMRVKPFWGD